MDSVSDVLKKAEDFLKEGDGQPGYDLPPEEVIDTPAEVSEVDIAERIIHAVNDLARLVTVKSGVRDPRANQLINEIRAQAARLRNMHVQPA
jgi:hypothetical protein